jgi:hypothetical protein
MSRALLADLREQVVGGDRGGVVLPGGRGALRCECGEPIRPPALARDKGLVAPGPLGGDRRSGKIEAHAPRIPALVEAKSDITLAEIRSSSRSQAWRSGWARSGASSNGAG